MSQYPYAGASEDLLDGSDEESIDDKFEELKKSVAELILKRCTDELRDNVLPEVKIYVDENDVTIGSFDWFGADLCQTIPLEKLVEASAFIDDEDTPYIDWAIKGCEKLLSMLKKYKAENPRKKRMS